MVRFKFFCLAGKIATFSVIIAAFLLSGCGRRKEADLRWQKYPFCVSCTIKSESRFPSVGSAVAQIEVSGSGKGRLSFRAPESLSGFVFDLNQEGASVSYDRSTVPAGESLENDLHGLFSLFSLDIGRLIDASVEKVNETSVNKAVFTLYSEYSAGDDNIIVTGGKPVGEVSVYISDEGIPKLMEADFYSGDSIQLEISGFKTLE